MKIEPMTEKVLNEVVSLVATVFPPEYEEEPGTLELPASLNPDAYQDFLKKTQMSNLKYWVAIDSGKVVGVVGLYCYEEDKKDAVWLGWYCVDRVARKRSTGTELLLFAIEEARKQGKKFLRLYTTTDPAERDAQRIFRRHGFHLIKEGPWEGDPELTKLYYELKLGA